MENHSEIKQWIETTCQERFQASLRELSSVSLFYLYHEIEQKYQVKIPPNKIEEGIFHLPTTLQTIYRGR
mgnify:CR=1 FL=1